MPSVVTNVFGTTSVANVQSPAVAAGQPLSVVLLAKVAMVATSASFEGVTPVEPIPPRREDCNAYVAVDATLQSMLIRLVPALTPTMRTPDGVATTVPGAVATTSLHGAAMAAAPTDWPEERVRPERTKKDAALSGTIKPNLERILRRMPLPVEECFTECQLSCQQLTFCQLTRKLGLDVLNETVPQKDAIPT